MTERFTVSMSDDGYEEMEADREARGLSRSAYVEQAVRKSVDRDTKTETLIEALRSALAMSVVLMAISVLWMFGAYATAQTVTAGGVLAGGGLFLATSVLLIILPETVEWLEERQTAKHAKKVDA